MPRDLVLLGRFGAPHGVRGDIKLDSFMEVPEAIFRSGPLTSETGDRIFAIKLVRRLPDQRFIVSVDGVKTREEAAALTNSGAWLERARLPSPQPDEFYWADLIGMRADTTAGDLLGAVAAVHDYGAGAFLEIRDAAGMEQLVPFTRLAIVSVDIAGRRIVIDLPSEVEAPAPT